jgi:beta-lactamase regulating signal transducer with metallopeptidase domain
MSTEFMQTWVFDSLLVTTLLMGAILLLRRPVAKAFGPGVAYALWLIPAARLLMPSLEGAPVEAAGDAQWVRDAVRESMLSGIPASDPVVVTASEMPAATIDWAALGLTFWLGGAALFFIIQMIRYASMRDDLLSEAEEIASIDGVRVVASDQVAGPLAFGLFKRYIAVPQDFIKTYSPAERELAIAHEMAHHKSGDLFANLAAFIVLCLQWFNPVAWMSWNAFRFDQEAACDARVLAGKGAEDRVIYGQALARTAFDGVPTFATALNSPKTIIERLRRLNMDDASTKRRIFGKLGIFTAAAIILPLTATVVPSVVAQETENAADTAAKPEKVKRHVKVIRLNRDSKDVHVIAHDGDGKEVTKVDRDGKTFIFRTDKQLSEDEAEKMVAEAEKSREEAERALAEMDAPDAPAPPSPPAAPSHLSADIAHARAAAELGRLEAMRAMRDMNIASYIPDIDIREITKNCKQGEPVSTDVSGFDGQSKSRVRVVMCGKGQAKIARLEALKGMREARSEIRSDRDIPDKVRKDVIEKLEQQIRKLEAEADRKD